MGRSLTTQRKALAAALIVTVSTSIMLACGLPNVLQGPTSVSADIKAAQGGTLALNGATLKIPVNALAADATVTLRDQGKHPHAKGDPLDYVSDAFSVNTKGSDGKPVLFKAPATLSIDPGSDATKNAQDFLVAQVLPTVPQAIQLHHSLSGGAGQGGATHAVNYTYSVLNSVMWDIRVPTLPAPEPHEQAVLQVPWYYQSGAQWCVPTSLTAMLRYYDFVPNSGDPLNATFGSNTALANWQIAAQSHQPPTSGAYYNELDNIGVPAISDSSGTGYVFYVWDDDLVITAKDLNGNDAHGNFNDFEVYTILVNTGIFGLVERKPLAMVLESWNHSVVVVGVDGTNIYIHDSNGPIAEKFSWTDFQTQARTWGKDGTEIHGIWTAVAYGYPIKPETMRRGSVVISRWNLRTLDGNGNKVFLEWDGAAPHTHGYYLNAQSDPGYGLSDLGYPLLRGVPLFYQYRIANVSDVPLTFTTVAEFSGPNYGDGLMSQPHSVTIDPYSVSDDISGSFAAPPGGGSAIFDVKLFTAGINSAVQDVKFIRFAVRDPGTPTVKIVSPANGTHVYVGSDVAFSATSVSGDTGHSLPDSDLTWTVNGSPVAPAGSNIVHTFSATGTYTITVTATNAAGRSATDTTTITVDPAPPAASATIVSPADGTYYSTDNATTYSVTLVASGSPGMQFSWTDNIDGSLGTGASITPFLRVLDTTNCAASTQHVITLSGTDNLGRTVTSQITIYLTPTCLR